MGVDTKDLNKGEGGGGANNKWNGLVSWPPVVVIPFLMIFQL